MSSTSKRKRGERTGSYGFDSDARAKEFVNFWRGFVVDQECVIKRNGCVVSVSRATDSAMLLFLTRAIAYERGWNDAQKHTIKLAQKGTK